jgi:hypothetical protein
MVADVALPTIFRALPNLRLADPSQVRIGGWAFRGVLNLPVAWGASPDDPIDRGRPPMSR